MAKKSYKWLERLIDKITKDDCPNNNHFTFYGKRVNLQSGTRDFMDVYISDMDCNHQVNFSFDFWTHELDFSGYNNFDERDTIIQAFKTIYGRSVEVTSDEPWNEEMKAWEPLLGDEYYDQASIQKEYDYLMSRKAA